MTKEEKGHFKLKSCRMFEDMWKDFSKGKTVTVPESDLCFQNDHIMFQFEYVEPSSEYKTKIEPGVFSLVQESNKIVTRKTELRSRNLLTSVISTEKILKEAEIFFNNLHVYEELGEPMARKILLYSEPGMGKTASMTQYCLDAVDSDPGTVVLVWPTGSLDAEDVSKFLSKYSEYDEKCTRLILLMEDIGGGERDRYHGSSRAVDQGMLDLLDGLEVNFKLPTLIISTTNYPQNLLSALADRPGRFDLIMELHPPSYEERVELVKFIGKYEELDEDTKEALDKHAKDFSVAHLKEVVIRSRLQNKSLATTIKEIRDHRKIFKKEFEKDNNNSLGFGRG